ncbi:unnamed protein product [Rotaria magnacalcarata]|uniref:TMEM205-like domain-containing protein n=1 Tax=Rotaria magnacalcarata TaxID=392030 RepID=A0A8S2KWK3_9BILA|nr:unnamed protein product [Rotaria magnacalcarata]
MLAKLLSSSAPYHLLSYASVTGITLWHSFIGGPVAFKTLPRQQFGLLQSKLFPIYFSLQTVLNGICLLTTSNRNGRIIFIIGLVGGLLNLAIVGPWTTKIMNERHKVEKEEGKQYSEPGISDRLKALNKRFGIAHGYCPTTNPCGKRDYCIDTINNNIDDPWQGQCEFWWEGTDVIKCLSYYGTGPNWIAIELCVDLP